MKNVVLLLLLIPVIGLGFLYFAGQDSSTISGSRVPEQSSLADQEQNNTEKKFADADFDKPDLIIGDPSAPVTIVEYADFKCPNCNKFHQDAGAEVRKIYVDTGRAKIVFRNYPFLGPDSGRAARGSYCSYDQGIFVEYHDAVFQYLWERYYSDGSYSAEVKDVLTVEVLTGLVSDKLTDNEKFSRCLEDTSYNSYIDADLLQGADDEANGTPTFVIGTQKIVGPSPFQTFKTLIEIAER